MDTPDLTNKSWLATSTNIKTRFFTRKYGFSMIEASTSGVQPLLPSKRWATVDGQKIKPYRRLPNKAPGPRFQCCTKLYTASSVLVFYFLSTDLKRPAQKQHWNLGMPGRANNTARVWFHRPSMYGMSRKKGNKSVCQLFTKQGNRKTTCADRKLSIPVGFLLSAYPLAIKLGWLSTILLGHARRRSAFHVDATSFLPNKYALWL